ncbi:MAG: GNAT family N-acetyltransferase [Bacteroidetes bacterium]|nr:GNAT family N-acetyltransferase [Bacteroidota bacterium]
MSSVRQGRNEIGLALLHDDSLSIRLLFVEDHEKLLHYLQGLSRETKSRFGPHAFDREAISTIFAEKNDLHQAYIAIEKSTADIIAYALLRKGWLPYDKARLSAYGLAEDPEHDCTFAPSVADAWQGKGLGSAVFTFVLNEIRSAGIRRILLWGGVQATNQRACGFYQRHGFRELGRFEHHGENCDMCLEL